ncbi:uncharacterized protein LOC126837296 [Adelges cooleyi]|uniref:uncharacterized protein LOC126837296 n=1 Tax=Adelges cooleyi TaxID=133065 RepID=UPI0021801A27|nr:uncharacterized protein LOC126837296 [Adelges cooleyi]
MSSIVEVQENISEISINDPEHIAENSNETESTQKSLSSSLRSKIGSKSKETTLGSINEEHQSDSALADTVADLSPPERSQLLQAESHQFILDMGADIENQVIGSQESKMREAFDRKLTAMDERMTYKLQEDVDQLRSDVKTKYEQKIYNFLNEINDIFLVSNRTKKL